MKDFNGGCKADIGSLTMAMKAQRLLGVAAIPTTVIKINSSSGGIRGCSYGLKFSCPQEYNVRTVLERERIRVKEWLWKED